MANRAYQGLPPLSISNDSQTLKRCGIQIPKNSDLSIILRSRDF